MLRAKQPTDINHSLALLRQSELNILMSDGIHLVAPAPGFTTCTAPVLSTGASRTRTS